MQTSTPELNAIAAAVRQIGSPLYVALGMGVDSVAVLVGLAQRGERPDAIVFANTGDEKPETYAYIDTLNAWLDRVGFPRVTIVKNPRPKSGDVSLSESCLRNGVLPALAYKAHQCSLVWKIDPQEKWIAQWALAIEARAAGAQITVCVGYDAGDRDSARCARAKSEGRQIPGTVNRYPLIEWGWDREECMRQIAAAGLPVPMKSACYHCPASKPVEIVWLKTMHRDLFDRAVEMERGAHARGLVSIAGLADMGNETFAQYDDGKEYLGKLFLAEFRPWKSLHAKLKRAQKDGYTQKAIAIQKLIDARRPAFVAARDALYA
jgi:3'-phosphoadenosine 5'-phosphosulfate sulfotransferase (PAPS reductase)/FAD synthetase